MWRVQEFTWQDDDGVMHRHKDTDPGVQSIVVTTDRGAGEFVITFQGDPPVTLVVSEELAVTAALHPVSVRQEPQYFDDWSDV